MKTVVLIILISLSAFAKRKEVNKFPIVETLDGKAFLIEEKVKVEERQALSELIEKRLSAKQILKDKARIKTSKEASLRIKLSKTATLIVSELSEIEFPAILWQQGKVEKVILHDGQLRIICDADCDLEFESKLFAKKIITGDFIFSYESTKPSIEVKVLDGEINFKGYENESEIALKSGQIGKFEGVFEDGEVAYDTLLRGRKVAKGKLYPLENIKPGFVEELLKQEQEIRQKAQKKKVVVKRKASQICDKPYAELNQCVYRCLNNKKGAKECLTSEGASCQRQRCNANGQWSDAVVLSGNESRCSSKEVVGSCDY